MSGKVSGLNIIGRILAEAVLICMADVANAQDDYPNRTIKIIVPLPPGGVADALPRILANKLSARWGQPVIIENRPGAANNLGAEVVAKAEPDGYTLLAAPQGALVISKSFYPKLEFDPTAFVPVSVIGTLPIVLVANPNAPFSTLQELVAFARANPNSVNYGSSGFGSAFQLVTEMLQATAGIRLTHVPYQGMAPAMTDLLAGHINMTVDNLGNALPHIKDGRLKVIGVASEKRIPELPGVPAIAETFPGFVFTEWFGVVAPPKTPPEIVAELSQAITEVLQQPDVEQRFRDFSVTPVGSSPLETATFLRQQRERWSKVIAVTGIKAQ